MVKDHKKLINNLDKIKKLNNIIQQELYISAEVSRKSIKTIENGVYIPSTLLTSKIVRTLNCKVEDLFELPI